MIVAVRPLSSSPAASNQIVGRGAQLESLLTIFAELPSTGAQFVMLGGDAGAGKTTLVDLFSQQVADRGQLIRGECVPLGGEGLPYAPIVGALRNLIDLHSAERVLDWAGAGGAGLGTVLPNLVTAPEPGDAVRLRLFEAVTEVLERAASVQPLIMIVEDLHWADDSTRHLLRFMASALTDAPVLVICTYRSDEVTRTHPLRPFLAEIGRLPAVIRMEVPRLDRAEVGQLLDLLMPEPPSRAIGDLIFERSDGIPYFIEELARSAALGCAEMPDTLRDALTVRVQTLSEAAQHTLRLASVFGNRVDHELLAAAATRSTEELDAALREAIDQSMLITDETGYAFRHALLREAIHDDLMPGEHARLHAHFARILEQRPELIRDGSAAPEIAHQWFAAHDVPRAFEWSLIAARAELHAHHEALKLFERALELWDQVPDAEAIAGSRVDLLEEAARVARDAGEPERALSLIQASLNDTDRLRDPLTAARRMVIAGQLLTALMRPGAIQLVSEAIALVPADPPSKQLVRALDQLAISQMLAGDRYGAIDTAREALAVAQSLGSPTLESSPRNTLGTCLVGLGQESEGLAELARAGELATGNMRVSLRYYINMSDALYLAGRFAEAAEVATTGMGAARSLGLERSLGAMLSGNAAEPLLALGDWDRARKLTVRALELNPPAHHYIHLRLVRAWIHLWSGELAEADGILAEFRHLTKESVRTPQYAFLAARTDGEFALATGDPLRAWEITAEFLDHVDLHHESPIYYILGIAAAAAARLQAKPEVDRAESKARLALVRAVLARCPEIGVAAFWRPMIEAELSDSAVAWHEAILALDRQPSPVHLKPYAYLRLAQQSLARSDRVQAKSAVASAAAEALQIGSGLLTNEIAKFAARSGLRPAGRTPSAMLTPRERDVLALVAQGRSNAEIGGELFISAKTASVHVSNILAKLSVTSRGEAAAVAHRDGLLG